MTPLAITGLGAVSSVGSGFVETCASIRAGISRPRPIMSFATLDAQTYEEQPLSGHPIPGVLDGFAPTARWQVMCQRAVSDLIAALPESSGLDGNAWSRCGVVFVLPVLEDARFFDVPPAQPANVWRSCLDPLLTRWGMAANPHHRELIAVGAAGTFRALGIAAGWLERRELERVLIVAVDSFLDAWSLNWLAEWGRLKHPAKPVGVVPGEAAAALLVERFSGTGAVAPLARVAACVYQELDEPFQNGERLQGRGAAAALLYAVHDSGTSLEGDLYVNLNGEEWRGVELGAALSTLPAGTAGTYRLVTPAASVGDVGAAAPTLQIACALRSFARGYAARPQAWVMATSDDGDVGAACLRAV